MNVSCYLCIQSSTWFIHLCHRWLGLVAQGLIKSHQWTWETRVFITRIMILGSLSICKQLRRLITLITLAVSSSLLCYVKLTLSWMYDVWEKLLSQCWAKPTRPTWHGERASPYICFCSALNTNLTFVHSVYLRWAVILHVKIKW